MTTLFSPAKINLYLHVTGRRTDGYHLLDSLVSFADIGDTLSFTPADQFAFTVSGPYGADFATDDLLTSADSKNLVVRAAYAISTLYELDLKVAIHLKKNLPLSSGIGGGSSNAAICLKGLTDFFKLNITPETLLNIAEALGSDVPVCITAQPCRMQGIGEIITPLVSSLPPCPILLINPNRPCATPQVFKAFNTDTYSMPLRPYDIFDTPKALCNFLNQETRNDLTEAALITEPSIQDVLQELQRTSGVLCARLSGSGATCFGLFATEAEAIAAQNLVKKNHPEWWVKSGWINRK